MHNCPNCGIALRKYDAFSYGNVTITESHEIFLNGERVSMSHKVKQVAEALIRNNGRIMDRGALLTAIETDETVEPRTIDVYVRRARIAFEAVDPNFDQMPTERGMGYWWKKKAAPVTEQPSLMAA